MTAIWPGTFVEEVTLARNISLLRKALGDTAGQDQSQYIETVSKRGYRFIARVREEKYPEDGFQRTPESPLDFQPTPANSPPSQQSLASQPKRFTRAAERFLWAGIPILALAIFAIGWLYLRTMYLKSTRSIVVLPFVDESKDPSTQYITDGITEGVIDKLSEIPGIRVISRNTAFKYKGKETDAQAVGRDLNVQAVLIGRIAQRPDAVFIDAKLVNVKDGRQLWSRRFQYPPSDLPRAQDELATSISNKLKLRLTSADEIRLASPATSNPEAYKDYLQARYHWNKRTPPAMKKSIELYQQATEKDPDFALAFAGFAEAYNMGNNFGVISLQGEHAGG
jgi:TolB-like protein